MTEQPPEIPNRLVVGNPDPNQDLNRVHRIVAERRARYQASSEQIAELVRSRDELLKSTRSGALRSGSLSSVAEIDSYKRRIDQQLHRLETDLAQQKEELQRAEKRLEQLGLSSSEEDGA